MNQVIRNLISLANLTKSGKAITKNICKVFQMALKRQEGDFAALFSQISKGVSGQIATMLTLMMVGMLVLILVTVNIGDVAMKKTAISNAADSAALQLGSQLSTISSKYVDALGEDKEDCQKTGWASAVIGAIVAIIAVIVTIITVGTATPFTASLFYMAVGMVAGALGAGISAWARTGTLGGSFWWSQFMLGASIGAAIGSGGYAIAGFAQAGVAAGETVVVTAGEKGGELTVKAIADTVVNIAGKETTVLAGTSQTFTLAAGQTAVITGASTVTTLGSTISTTTVAAGQTATFTNLGSEGGKVTITAGENGATVIDAGGKAINLGAGQSTEILLQNGQAVTVTQGSATATAAQGVDIAVTGMAPAVTPGVTPPPTTPVTPPSPGFWTQVGNYTWSGLQAGWSVLNFILYWVSAPLRWIAQGIGYLTSFLNSVAMPGLSGARAFSIGQALNMALYSTAAVASTMVPAEARISEAMSQYTRAINSLDDWGSLKEGTFLSALGKIVDDPNYTGTVDAPKDCYINGMAVQIIGDPYDSDGDGDTAESVPCFQYWEERRLQALKDANNNAYGFVTNFWSDLINFKDYVKTNILNDASAPNYLSREAIEGADGEIVGFVHTLEPNPWQNVVSFWQEGPTQEQFDNWQAGVCPPPEGAPCPENYLQLSGYDEIDYSVENFSGFVDLVEELESQGLNSSWQYWIDWLYQDPAEPGYDPATDDSYYAIFNKILYGSDEPGEESQGLYDWQDAINNIETNLTECIIDVNTGSITNAPCKHTYTPAEPYYYATIDSNPDDEFVVVESQINDMVSYVLTFIIGLQNLSEQINQTIMTVGPDFGGYNPVVYSWRDNNGEHKVTVQVSSTFKVPKTKKEKRGDWWSGESCVVLKNYEDTTGQNTWVRVRREEVGAADRPVGILGFWRTGGGVIEKTTHVSYNDDQVKLVD